MDDLIENLIANPLISFALVLLCVFLFFAVLKGLVKLILAILVFTMLGIVYINYFQDDYPLPFSNEEIIEKWNKLSEPIRSIDLNNSFFENNKSIIPLHNLIED